MISNNMTIKCKHCNTPTRIDKFKGFIYMKCMCDENVRILILKEVIDLNKYNDYLVVNTSYCK